MQAMKYRSLSVLVLLVGMGMIAVHGAKADTIVSTTNVPPYTDSSGVYHDVHYYQVTYTFNLDQSTYAPGAPITAVTTISDTTCSNGLLESATADVSASVNGSTKTLYNAAANGSLSSGQSNFTAPSTPGTYTAVFNGSDLATYDNSPLQENPVSDSIPYTVQASGGTTPSGPSTSSTTSGSSTSGGVTASTTPTVPPPQPPVCSFTGNPSHIVIPESSNLYYSCVNVTACSLSGGQFGSYPGISVPVNSSLDTASGTQAVQPNTDTGYQLNCTEADNGVNYSDELETYVIVDSPNLIEISPH
jgi:hypothetical protein